MVSRAKLLILALVLLFVSASFAQETTAGIQGTVKDSQGAVVAKAVVEVSGPALIGVKKMDTDAAGYYRFTNLPPGAYILTVAAKGFTSYKASGIDLTAGRFPTLDVSLKVGNVSETIEVTGAAPLVDVSQSKVQTVLSDNVLADLPKGRSFQSVIALAPGARQEPLQGGYQINGATNSENAYLIEGVETANIQTGASDTNAPMEFIQEVQVKSSGFEAEYGGALGGVVNVIQKRGSNAWHGSVLSYLNRSELNANDNPVVRRDPNNTGLSSALRHDANYDLYDTKKDAVNILEPGYEVGGALVKDRVWIFSSFIPRMLRGSRTVNFTGSPNSVYGTGPTTPYGTRTFNYTDTTYYALNRLDVMPFSKLRIYTAWQYNYRRGRGYDINKTNNGLPWQDANELNLADSKYSHVNVDAGSNPDNFQGGQGFVRPSVLWTVGGDWNISNSMVATTRFGYFYNDNQDRGVVSGTRYWYRDTNYNYGTSIGGSTAAVALNGTTLASVAAANPAAGAYVHTANFSNIGDNSNSFYDKLSRISFSQDLAWYKKFGGVHNFKFGYAFNRLYNDVYTTFSDPAQFYVAFGQSYTPYDNSNCAAIRAYNLSTYGNAGTNTDDSCVGLWGTINIREVSTLGKVSSFNHAFFLQDAWSPTSRLTLNLGVRFDKETLPSYSAGNPGINFGFGDKFAPRLGASYDVLGNGKLKAYASFGYFYDIMKFELPRGSFGGDYWHDCVYALDTWDLSKITPFVQNNHFCPTSGPANGVAASIPGVARFIENFDYRMPVNDKNNNTIDPNLKPMKQHESVFGVDWALRNDLSFEARYSRKRLDRTIEDAGVLVNGGEQYFIVNPGFGINAAKFCDNCPANPKAIRNYDGLEFRLTKRAAAHWGGSLSYTYSRLYGNYSGLTATDISDGGAARNSPNVDRSFDEPFMAFTPNVKSVNGPLATDRPHTVSGYGYYRLRWLGMESTIGLFQQLYSGSPVTSYLSVWGAPVFPYKRGTFVDLTQNSDGTYSAGTPYERRTPMFSQTDINLNHELKVSKSNEALRLGFEFNVLNVLNSHSPTFVDGNILRTSYIRPAGGGDGDYSTMLTTGYDWLSLLNTRTSLIKNYRYGQPYAWQTPRSVRMRIKFSF